MIKAGDCTQRDVSAVVGENGIGILQAHMRGTGLDVGSQSLPLASFYLYRSARQMTIDLRLRNGSAHCACERSHAGETQRFRRHAERMRDGFYFAEIVRSELDL